MATPTTKDPTNGMSMNEVTDALALTEGVIAARINNGTLLVTLDYADGSQIKLTFREAREMLAEVWLTTPASLKGPLSIQEVAEAIGQLPHVLRVRWTGREMVVDFPRERGGRSHMTAHEARKFLAKQWAEMLPAGVAPGSVVGPRQDPNAGYVVGAGSIQTTTKVDPMGTTTTARLVPCARCADDRSLGIENPNHAAH
jgi:hypothetical protein